MYDGWQFTCEVICEFFNGSRNFLLRLLRELRRRVCLYSTPPHTDRLSCVIVPAGAGEMGPPEAVLPPRLVAGMLPPRSTKKRPALRVEQVFVDFGTALRRAFAMEQATHGVHGPDSSITSCFDVSRVNCSLGWPSSRASPIHRAIVTPSKTTLYFQCCCSVAPSPRISQIPRDGRYRSPHHLEQARFPETEGTDGVLP